MDRLRPFSRLHSLVAARGRGRAFRFGMALAAMACLALALPAHAQDLSRMCDEVLKVREGQWAEYRMSSPEAGGFGKMRLAIVGTREVAGQKAWWIEMQMEGEPGRMITQVLANGYPYETSQIQELVVKMGDQPAMRMPRQGLAMMGQRAARGPSMGGVAKCKQARVVGWESVSVPAGEFRALHIQPADEDAQVWASPEIPFGMIKVEHAEGQIVLLGHGSDAKSSIRETPRAMPGMPGMGGP